ncbi:OsmC family protein [Cyclobacteriaceae bacterium]|jgi:putative redox protein|nr:OsmC family protein [Cyclobacteriaceae bacterium]
MKIALKRINKGVHLEATNSEGNKVQIDGAPSIGGEGLGARPMELLIMGLGGCSSMDILNILSKQKVELDDFDIDINAERDTENTPSLFTNIHVIFKFKGSNLEEKLKKIDRAVNLSMDKYCSVTKIMEKTAKITHEIVIEA